MKKIAVLISGQGSNLQAIIEACQTGFIPGKIVTVISNKIDSFGLERAKSAGIPSRVFLRQDFTSNLDMDKAISDYLDDLNVDLIVLAGYMKILTKPFTQRFAGKILNIHPSLLPKYPGLHTYQRVLENGDSEHGTTVHFSMKRSMAAPLYYKLKCRFSLVIPSRRLSFVHVNRNIIFIL